MLRKGFMKGFNIYVNLVVKRRVIGTWLEKRTEEKRKDVLYLHCCLGSVSVCSSVGICTVTLHSDSASILQLLIPITISHNCLPQTQTIITNNINRFTFKSTNSQLNTSTSSRSLERSQRLPTLLDINLKWFTHETIPSNTTRTPSLIPTSKPFSTILQYLTTIQYPQTSSIHQHAPSLQTSSLSLHRFSHPLPIHFFIPILSTFFIPYLNSPIKSNPSTCYSLLSGEPLRSFLSIHYFST